MNCDYMTLFLHDYVDGYLSTEQANLISSHIQCCSACQEKCQQIQAQKHDLAQLPCPQLTADFTHQALKNVKLHYADKLSPAKKNKYQQYYLTMAASFVLVCVLAFTLSGSPTDPLNEPVKMALNHQEQVNLVFNAPKELKNVQFTVILPAEIEMLGHPGKRQVIWSGKLQAGRNLLSIPVLTTPTYTGILTTKLEYENNSKTFKVPMKIKPGKNVT